MTRTPYPQSTRLNVRKPQCLHRFVEEAQITGQLDHPNIVPVYEFGTLAGDQAYFTMKLVTGWTPTMGGGVGVVF